MLICYSVSTNCINHPPFTNGNKRYNIIHRKTPILIRFHSHGDNERRWICCCWKLSSKQDFSINTSITKPIFNLKHYFTIYMMIRYNVTWQQTSSLNTWLGKGFYHGVGICQPYNLYKVHPIKRKIQEKKIIFFLKLK